LLLMKSPISLLFLDAPKELKPWPELLRPKSSVARLTYFTPTKPMSSPSFCPSVLRA